MMGKDYITLGEACLKAGINRERLLRRVQAGEIDGRLLDGRWVVRVSSLSEFVAALRRGAGRPRHDVHITA